MLHLLLVSVTLRLGLALEGMHWLNVHCHALHATSVRDSACANVQPWLMKQAPLVARHAHTQSRSMPQPRMHGAALHRAACEWHKHTVDSGSPTIGWAVVH